MDPLRFGHPPPLWRSYLAALAARRPAVAPAGTHLPRLEARLDAARLEPARLAAYRRLCAFPDDGALPLTAPHVLATPLHLALLAAPGFPVRLLGLVHLANAVTRRRTVLAGEPLALACVVRGPTETDRGQEFVLETEARAGGEVVWTETTTFLARRPAPRGAPRPPAATGPLHPPGADAIDLTLPEDLGRRYARASGDWNPIHLAAPAARLFGFPRAIAHGMWSLGRIAAALEARGGAPLGALEARFKAPLFLPGAARLASWETGGAIEFVLVDPAGARPHVTGTARPAPA